MTPFDFVLALLAVCGFFTVAAGIGYLIEKAEEGQ